ncbi:MAG: rhodanese-like domain-containing protein [Bacteroidales bacterium]|nr:rhodanese-like domain-containing protein [Bacteroidales bacterium]
MKKQYTILLFILAIFFASCGNEKKSQVEKSDGFDKLIEYMETNGDLVNSKDFPFFVSAPEVYNGLTKNYLVIDIRMTPDFDSGHIANSVNVRPDSLVKYFTNSINAKSFDTIVIVCNSGHASAFCATGIRYLGYDNVFPMKYGLSAWDSVIALNYRLKNISDLLIDKLDTTNTAKNPAGKFPVLMTEFSEPYDILKYRLEIVLSEKIGENFVTIDEVINNPSSYYIISYWPEDIYKNGHIPGAVNYEPKKSLKKSEFLNTLPTDKTIIVDCYGGNHSSFVIMYLRLLGYDAKNIIGGANAYMYSIISEQGMPGRFFKKDDIYNFPLVKSGQQAAATGDAPKKPAPKGGC